MPNGIALLQFIGPRTGLIFLICRCQPCKELTPRLEKAVSAKKGIRLAKLNVDLEPDIAGQLRVEVLPTLFLIYEVLYLLLIY